MEEQKTPLYDTHVKYKGKIVPFGGYLLPVQYEKGVIAEHMAVRTACGLFDVSHMGEIVCKGPDALESLNYILTNDFSGMYDGQARYSPMCNDNGGVVDDLIVYRVNEETYLLVVNAANREKDYQWIKAHESGNVNYTDISSEVAQLALQGPAAGAILSRLTDSADIPTKYYSCCFDAHIDGMKCMISKTGYTGEDGYEIYISSADAEKLWELLIKEGESDGLIPCGLGARDTLRLEAAMPLYGHEMTEDISPLDTGLGSFVKMQKEDFIGKSALAEKGEPSVKRVGIKVTGRGIVREHCELYDGEKKIGMSTSGTHCPFFKESLAMALVDKEYAEAGTAFEAEVRGKRIPVEVVSTPFYTKSMRKKY